jgi:hypothetical protein
MRKAHERLKSAAVGRLPTSRRIWPEVTNVTRRQTMDRAILHGLSWMLFLNGKAVKPSGCQKLLLWHRCA